MPSWRCLFAVPSPRRGVEASLLLLARIVAGVMFCVSGWNKVFTEAGRERMVHTLVDAGIPFPVFNAPVLGAIEWIAGGLLVLGLLSRPSALLLAAICAVAALTDGIARIPAGLSVPDWLSWFFYLSEVPLGVLLLWIAAVGSGRFAIEARWARSRNL
ncbi:DoxX family protein [Stenotrophomonas maltophilia]|uniref:DoxX family protein n=1 Tax=Stenotrophomonas forensis TaxID=2871169 RepID=A0ABY7XYG2_9GAMM|nr:MULTISPECIES: DoxX family protein [Stenotrophomonas]ALA83532.1 transmembrane DoxX protein [Stenotrophomonas maltophilia]MBH1478479.1 DoxX family protein [Stenotrophomonas maltophilia]MBH1504348.1 DoxX family protein [Stenotrophomonas maltophilia]MBH1787670.1 DoxX family protein [Stenotrophomonas maltophilia]WDM62760.1 DoxX family protein [Stenotrophomonas sp. DFS-20110405]